MPAVFDSMSLKLRLILGFAAVLLMMVVLTAIGVLRVNAINRSLVTINEVNSVKQRYAINFRGSVHDRAIALRDVVLVADPADMKAALDEIEQLTRDYAQSARPLDQIFADRSDISVDERAILASIKDIEARTLPLIEKVIALQQGGESEQAQQLMLAEARPAFIEWLARINRFIDLQESKNNVEAATAGGLARGFQQLMLGLCLAALAIGAAVATLIARRVIGSLGAEPGDVKAVVDAVGRGELFHEVRLRDGDRDSIMATLSQMTRTLRSTVLEVRQAAEQVGSTSRSIGESNSSLSSRTEQQAGALEETASSMEELTTTVRQNADNARQANLLATSASDVAGRGGAVVEEVVATMGSINESARRIVDIIGVIDGIAFQTNILALNAAVEAARAGEQGRGFAVVATEVRNLAQRSAAAAKEIKSLIGHSVEKVEAGSRLVEQAGSTMREIVESVRRVTDIMGEISAASQAQSAGIEQVNQAIGQMDQVTQQNAALVEEAAQAADSLQGQANQLARAVAAFRLEQHAAAGTPEPSLGTPLPALPDTAGKALFHAVQPSARRLAA